MDFRKLKLKFSYFLIFSLIIFLLFDFYFTFKENLISMSLLLLIFIFGVIYIIKNNTIWGDEEWEKEKDVVNI